jgi:hypothetical protein
MQARGGRAREGGDRPSEADPDFDPATVAGSKETTEELAAVEGSHLQAVGGEGEDEALEGHAAPFRASSRAWTATPRPARM